ncbi:MAG TPA: zf-HC2 domain-containing protein [Jiangellaceae bacterium]
MKHIGERVTALVDDQLGHDDRDRALAHVMNCEQCRIEVERERETKAALRRLADVEPPASLVAALLALAEPGDPLPPQRRPFPGAAASPVGWRAGTTRPGGGRPDTVTGPRRPDGAPRLNRRRGRIQVAAAAVLSAGALTLALATLGGSVSASAPVAVVPPMERFTVEHARSTGSLPFADPATVLVPVTTTVAPDP